MVHLPHAGRAGARLLTLAVAGPTAFLTPCGAAAQGAWAVPYTVTRSVVDA